MPKLFMALLGATPPGRNIEQHDIFFGIGEDMKDLVPQIAAYWPVPGNKIHIDAWREVTRVDDYSINVLPAAGAASSPIKLFFINLGGYKQDEFEEFHYKMLVAAPGKGEAVAAAKKTAFFRHTGFKGASSHIDDKFGIDVDDIFEIPDILSVEAKSKYKLVIVPANDNDPADEIHLGYFKLNSFA